MLEFGLFFPFLALMLLGTIDLARGLAVKFGLDQATQRTIELATLGNRPLADYSFLRAEAATAAGVPVAQVTLDQ
jgi:Flp pilus assembly protein TadG